VRSINVIAIYQDFAGAGRGIDFKPGRLGKFDANASRDGTQPPIVVRRRLYAQVSPAGEPITPAPRAAPCNLSVPLCLGPLARPLFHSRLGRPHNHKNDVAVSCLCVDPLERASAGYGAVAGPGFGMGADDLKIEIS